MGGEKCDDTYLGGDSERGGEEYEYDGDEDREEDRGGEEDINR